MFEIIGERINTSRKHVQAAVAERNADYIIDDVKQQQAAGASFIDVNAGARIGHEKADMEWLLNIIQQAVDTPLALDSPDPAILEMAFSLTQGTPLINSISLETERFESTMPFLAGKTCKVIALCMDNSGMPANSDEIVDRAGRLIKSLNDAGIPTASIYIDPVIQPISTDTASGSMVLEAIRDIKAQYPDVHVTGGLSNISFGLPQRFLVNRTFIAMLMLAGMDSAIVDPLDKKIMATIRTAGMLLGNDAFCMEYLKGVRAGTIES